jgi:hypothetical protein
VEPEAPVVVERTLFIGGRTDIAWWPETTAFDILLSEGQGLFDGWRSVRVGRWRNQARPAIERQGGGTSKPGFLSLEVCGTRFPIATKAIGIRA